jgi:hypothetical protein
MRKPERLTALSTLAIFFATIVAALVGFAQWRELHKTDKTVQESLVAGTRAWVVPTGAKVDGPLKAGTSVRIKILYENTGREPAQHMRHIWAWNVIPVKTDAANVPYIGAEETPWPAQNLQCLGDVGEGGRPVYPGSKNEDIRYIFNGNPIFVSQELIEKKASFVIFGCLVYQTFNVTRHSPYCFFFQPHRDRPIDDATMEFCPISYGVAD